MSESTPMSAGMFRSLAKAYRDRWPVRLALTTPGGDRCRASGWWPGADPVPRRDLMAFVIGEGLRWGEPTVTYGPGGNLFWAAPVMVNASLRGGVVATIHEDVLFVGSGSVPTIDLRAACTALREALERANLTNAAFLEAQRWRYRREQERAERLAAGKLGPGLSVRELYFRAEPELIAAIRRGDRPTARAALNRVLTALLADSGERFDLVRSYCVELVAAMHRSVVEARADADGPQPPPLGTHGLMRLARAESMESLAPALRESLERSLDAMRRSPGGMHATVIAAAVAHMREHLAEPLSRDRVAEAVNVSPSHFSRLFGEQTGLAFGRYLMRMRVDHAAELLVRTDLPLAEVARDSGFLDPSYFGKVFRRQTGQTPATYRRERRADATIGEDGLSTKSPETGRRKP